MTGYLNGIAPPPGYPLHTALSHVFTHLPVGSVAFRAHMLSAVFGAATCSILWGLCFRVLRSRALAYMSALGYGLSLRFHFDAIHRMVFQVYPLVSYGVMALWLAFGFGAFHRIRRKQKQSG